MVSRKGSDEKRQEFLRRTDKGRGMFDGIALPDDGQVLVSGNSLWIHLDVLEDVSSTRVRGILAKVHNTKRASKKKAIMDEELANIVSPSVAQYILDHESDLYEE